MDRRNFIRGLLGTMAMAMAPIAAVAGPYQKYHTALGMFDELVEANQQRRVIQGFMPETFDYKQDHEMKDLLHVRLDALLEFVHANFAIPDPNNKDAHRATAKVLRGSYDEKWNRILEAPLEEQFRKIPPVLMEEVWPIAMMKLILWDYGMPINHRKLKQFKTFHDRYAHYILHDA